MDRERQKLQLELAYLKREKDVMEQRFETRRFQILEQIRLSSQSLQNPEIQRQILEVNVEYRREMELYQKRILEIQDFLRNLH
jgi:hypothetical protein